MTPKVSVIVLNYNGARVLEGCLNSVMQTRYPNREVIVVDNGSTDGSGWMMEKRLSHSGDLKFIFSPVNLGFSGGNNLGSTHASGEYLAFLNNDVTVEPGWLGEAVRVLQSYRDVGIVSSRVISKQQTGPQVGNIDRFCNGTLLRFDERSDVSPTVISSGPAFLITRKAWETIRGFDPYYFLFLEDVDLAWRALIAGYRSVQASRSVVKHEGGENTGRLPRQFRRYLFYRNSCYTLAKNSGVTRLLIRLPVASSFHLVEALALAWKEKSLAYIVAYIRAITHFSGSLRRVAEQRRVISTYRVNPHSTIDQVMSRGPPWMSLQRALRSQNWLEPPP